jgi:cytochrome c-type biogenesis protein CcmH
MLSWAAAIVVLAGALALGTFGDRGGGTQQERVFELANQVKCPQCAGQTVADSDTASAREIRQEIAADLQEGKSDDEVLAELAQSYGDGLILTPTSSGVTGLVWVLPVVLGVAALAGLVVAFRRWSGVAAYHATDADRELVAGARQGHGAAGGGPAEEVV